MNTNTVIVLLLFLSVFILAEYAYKRKFPTFITRKIVHIGGGFVTASLPLFVDLNTVLIIAGGFFLLLVWSKQQEMLGSIHDIDEDSVGALLFAPTVALTAVFFWPINQIIFQGAILVLGLSDGLAGLVGKKYGKRKYSVTGNKTIEGSIVFFLSTFLILLAVFFTTSANFTLQILGLIFVGSVVVTVVEGLSGKGWDNLLVPISTALVLLFIL